MGSIDWRWPGWGPTTRHRQPWLATVEWGVIAADQALHLSILAMLAVLG